MEMTVEAALASNIPIRVELTVAPVGIVTAATTKGSAIKPKTPSEKIECLLKPVTSVLWCRQPTDALSNIIPQPIAKNSGFMPKTRARAMSPIPVNIVALAGSVLTFIRFSILVGLGPDNARVNRAAGQTFK